MAGVCSRSSSEGLPQNMTSAEAPAGERSVTGQQPALPVVDVHKYGSAATAGVSLPWAQQVEPSAIQRRLKPASVAAFSFASRTARAVILMLHDVVWYMPGALHLGHDRRKILLY